MEGAYCSVLMVVSLLLLLRTISMPTDHHKHCRYSISGPTHRKPFGSTSSGLQYPCVPNHVASGDAANVAIMPRRHAKRCDTKKHSKSRLQIVTVARGVAMRMTNRFTRAQGERRSCTSLIKRKARITRRLAIGSFDLSC